MKEIVDFLDKAFIAPPSNENKDIDKALRTAWAAMFVEGAIANFGEHDVHTALMSMRWDEMSYTIDQCQMIEEMFAISNNIFLSGL